MTPQAPRRVFVPKTVDAWLDALDGVREADLPCNVSTVAYAVRAASLYREAYRHMAAVVDELAASISGAAAGEAGE